MAHAKRTDFSPQLQLDSVNHLACRGARSFKLPFEVHRPRIDAHLWRRDKLKTSAANTEPDPGKTDFHVAFDHVKRFWNGVLIVVGAVLPALAIAKPIFAGAARGGARLASLVAVAGHFIGLDGDQGRASDRHLVLVVTVDL